MRAAAEPVERDALGKVPLHERAGCVDLAARGLGRCKGRRAALEQAREQEQQGFLLFKFP